MTSWIVADSGILLSSALSGPYSAKAEELLRLWQTQELQIAAPSLFWYEITAVVRRHVHHGTLTADDGIRVRDQLLSKPVRLMIDGHLIRRGYELATQFNRPTAYDTQYLAVAERLRCEFWTADERLFNVVKQNLVWVKWVGDFIAPSS